jgi:site-specific recombinase XerD
MNAFDSIHPVPAAWLRASALAPYMPIYRCHLVERRYAPATVRMYLCGVAHFARWSRRRRLDLGHLGRDVDRFLVEHLPQCACPYPVQRCRHQIRAALRQMQAVLAGAGIRSDAHRLDPIEAELRRFDEYMQQAKGLAENTRIRRLSVVRSMMNQTSSAMPTAGGLRHFIAQELTRICPASAGLMASALRSYLRFRAFGGDRVEHLLPLIAAPACWRLAPIPQTLSRVEVAQLLDAFPPELPSRLRSYAMVRCLVDLGLRSREVINLDLDLDLDDIDWTAGILRIVKGKSCRVDVMPLPQATGGAIAAYLRSERPQTTNRRIFVRHVAPMDEPVGPDVVRRAVREAYRRCGLPYTRVHILRQTLASHLLDTGGTLKEVADVLRHRELNTSLIYAKVDLGRFSDVAMPWPGSAA